MALDDIALSTGAERAESSRRQKIRVIRKGKISAPSENLTDERHARVAEIAYRLYEQRDRHDGHDLEDWLEAERQVISQDR
jgi:hypothetical protein